jgi:hypothetical protein
MQYAYARDKEKTGIWKMILMPVPFTALIMSKKTAVKVIFKGRKA